MQRYNSISNYQISEGEIFIREGEIYFCEGEHMLILHRKDTCLADVGLVSYRLFVRFLLRAGFLPKRFSNEPMRLLMLPMAESRDFPSCFKAFSRSSNFS